MWLILLASLNLNVICGLIYELEPKTEVLLNKLKEMLIM